MSRQYSYSTTTTASRNITPHGTSSAFSSSANPDEDWTKISDLAERRRIQNRIAQRNYRKKLKRRLEDLERRAGSSSASPPQIHAEIHQSRRESVQQQYKRSPEPRQQQISPRLLPSQYTPPMQSEDDILFSNSFDRDSSRTPPLFSYHTYPAPEDVVYPPYPHSQPYRGDWSRPDSDYLAPVPVTLPSMMQFHDSIKREHEDTMAPYNMSYGLPSLDLHAPPHHAYEPDPHTPPLSYDHPSVACEEDGMSAGVVGAPGFQYPTTPLSMPPSPPLMTTL